MGAADESEDGWRASFDSSLANGETIDSGHGEDEGYDAHGVLASSKQLASINGDGDGGWQLAESKRTKRSKATAAAAAAAAHDGGVNGSQASLASSSQLLDGSLVDLGSQQQHSESTPGTSIAGSSALTSSSSSSSPSTSAQSLRAATASPSHTSPQRSRLLEESIFSDLAVDVSTDRIEDQGKRRRREGGGGKSSSSSRKKKKKHHGRKNDVSATAKNGDHIHPSPIFSLEATYSSHLPPHRDERQVDLDVRRSFVTEPDTPHRRARRRQLQDLIVGVLRRHPGLSYYQGYHDVVSVLLVVLVPEVRMEEEEGSPWPTKQDFHTCLTATMRLSLLYLRDFMAPSLEPCLGWLKALRNVVRSADGDFARDVVERAGGGGALPFFALSWLITLLSHDVGPPECEAARRVVDVVLCEGPVGMLWILAGLVMEANVKEHSVEAGDDEGDPDMLHHSLSKLPTRLADDEEGSDAALQRVFARAAHLRKLYGGEDDAATPPPWQGIMGPKSVLSTWPAARKLDWAAREAQADECLPPVPNPGEKIKPTAADGVVLDPYPTPPGSDGGFYDGDGGAAPPPTKHSRRRPSQSRAALPSTSTALFIFGGAAVVVVASAAAVMLSSSGPGGPGNAAERAARMRTLFNDAAHLGKGLARIVAMTAGGAAARGGT